MWRSCHSGCSSSHTTHVRRSSWQVSFHCHHEVYTQCAGEVNDYDYMFDSTIWLTLLYVIIAIHFTKACWCDSQGLSYPCHQRRGRCSRARTRVKVRRMTALGPPEAHQADPEILVMAWKMIMLITVGKSMGHFHSFSTIDSQRVPGTLVCPMWFWIGIMNVSPFAGIENNFLRGSPIWKEPPHRTGTYFNNVCAQLSMQLFMLLKPRSQDQNRKLMELSIFHGLEKAWYWLINVN